MANDGSANWAKLYIPGRETPQSLMRFIPHDENAKATEIKSVYPKARSRKKPKIDPTSHEAAFAMLGYRRQ